MTNAEVQALIDKAVAELKQTTVGYVNKHWKTPPAGTHWANALEALGVAYHGLYPDPPPLTHEGRVGYFIDMGGGWADHIVADSTLHDEALAQWDGALSWLPSMTSWYPRAVEYIDSMAVYKTTSGAPQHPEWCLKDSSGRYVYVDYACSNGTCTQYAADVGGQGWRDNIVARAKDAVAKGFMGVHLDDVNLTWRFSDGSKAVTPIDPRTGKPMVLADWQRYFCEMLELVRQAIPNAFIVHNSIWFAGPNHDGRDAVSQRQFRAADMIMYEYGFNDGGLTGGTGEWSFDRLMRHMDAVHDAGANVWVMSHAAATQQNALFNLAGALMVSRGGDMVYQAYGHDPLNFWPGWKTDLGAAKGPRYQVGIDIWQREFDGGLVTLNIPTRTGMVG